jgi:hypothetical protein
LTNGVRGPAPRWLLYAGLVGLGLSVGACGGESGPREVLVDGAAASGIDEDLASCLVDGLFDELGAERAEEVILTEDPADLSAEDRAILTEVEIACAATPADEAPGVTIEE